jgi:hypothetical protein
MPTSSPSSIRPCAVSSIFTPRTFFTVISSLGLSSFAFFNWVYSSSAQQFACERRLRAQDLRFWSCPWLHSRPGRRICKRKSSRQPGLYDRVCRHAVVPRAGDHVELCELRTSYPSFCRTVLLTCAQRQLPLTCGQLDAFSRSYSGASQFSRAESENRCSILAEVF